MNIGSLFLVPPISRRCVADLVDRGGATGICRAPARLSLRKPAESLAPGPQFPRPPCPWYIEEVLFTCVVHVMIMYVKRPGCLLVGKDDRMLREIYINRKKEEERKRNKR